MKPTVNASVQCMYCQPCARVTFQDRSLRSTGTAGCVYGRPGAMTVKRRENFQFKILTTKQRTVKNYDMSFDEVRNSLEISFAEGSFTEEEFSILTKNTNQKDKSTN